VATTIFIKKAGAYVAGGSGGLKVKVGGVYTPVLSANVKIKGNGFYQNPVDPPHVPAAFSSGFSSGFA